MTTQSWGFSTRQIHAGHQSDPVTGATTLPIYQANAYEFPSAEEAAARFSLDSLGPIYTRLGNPTSNALEARLADLEGGVGALLTSSGHAAQALAFLTLANTGASIVVSPHLYGGTSNQLRHSFRKLGIEARFVTNPRNRQEWIDLADDTTVAFFGETIANPSGHVLDIETVAEAADEVGVPLIVDNTVATPYLCRPIEWGASIVVHSATKYLGGHGNSMAGVIVDAGTFDYSKHPERFPDFNQPDPSYHGLVYARDLGADGAFGQNLSFILKARLQGQRDFGFSPSPFNAFLIEQGIQTLSLRMERHVENANQVAQFLAGHPAVTQVHYPGLETSPFADLAQKYTPRGASSLLSFDLDGGVEAGREFVAALKLFAFVANLGDTRSLAIHPASTTHSQLSKEQLVAAGVGEGTIRLSVGIEDATDLIADLDQALAAVGGKK
ncbi:MAG: O-acetylhomoserine aminocarboxypropyltransferase/cysteine synthase [Actinomycetaceae bacterium]|nr:O-acetylhomoserine aminocarboxypropyltransferase/cysteine synthase [Actinomycetaceae bacterium]